MKASAAPEIVLINDDPTQLNIFEALCQKGGYSTRAFTSPADGLKALAKAAPPALIITDLYMPGIDGWRLCRLLRSPEFASLNETPILVTSATFGGCEANNLTAGLGANAFLAVPVDGVKFVDTVRTLVSGGKPAHTSRVLIVEDEPDLTELLRNEFRSHGYLVDTASTGAEALQRIQNQPQDLVVLDYHLPDTRGDHVLAELRKRYPTTATIMMTGDTRPELALDWMNKGAGAYVRKPFDAVYLIRLCDHIRRERALLGVEDVLEQRTRQLREQKEKYRIVADFTLDWEYWIGSDGQFQYVSPSCERLTGYRAEEFYADPSLVTKIVHPEDRELMARHLEGQNKLPPACHFEFRLLHRDGRTLWIEHWCQPVTREDGSHLGFRASNRDISERRHAEEAQRALQRQVHEARRLESLGVLAGGLAHDFNNLLLVIQGNAALAFQETPALSAGRKHLQEIDKACQRAADLCRQMLAYAGQSRLAVETVHLSQLVKEMWPLLSASTAKKTALRLQLAAELPPVRGDSNHLRQVISNLVVNGLEALAEVEGTVTIATGVCECSRADLQGVVLDEDLPEGTYVWLEVTDTGSGIDPETQRRMFEPFFTTKFLGRGVGLSAALGIVRAHKGVLKVQSAPGKGSSFRALFPAAAEK